MFGRYTQVPVCLLLQGPSLIVQQTRNYTFESYSPQRVALAKTWGLNVLKFCGLGYILDHGKLVLSLA